MLSSSAGALVYLMIVTAQKINDFGKHLWALPDPEKNTRVFLKILYVYIIFYYTAVVTVKLAMYVLHISTH